MTACYLRLESSKNNNKNKNIGNVSFGFCSFDSFFFYVSYSIDIYFSFFAFPTSNRSSVWGGTLNMKLYCIIEVFLIQCVVVLLLLKCHCGEQGWRIGERTRLPPMWPGSPSIWEVSPLPSPPLNSQHFQIPIRPEIVKEEPLCGCATSKSVFILFF